MKGYTGKILHVDLSQRTFKVEEPQEAFYRKYMGGSAIGAYYCLTGMRPGMDAFDPGNVLVFAASCTTGAPVSGASRYNVTAKSPLTGALGDSQAGGFWGAELKFAGFDAIVITGKSENPCFIWIHDGQFELMDAEGLWGLETGEAQAEIRRRLGDKRLRAAIIGPAGENLVRYACITNELKHFNGRTGMGAVMGSKNLKAIAVRGTKSPEFADRDAIIQMAKSGSQRSQTHGVSSFLREFGTAGVVSSNQAIGGLPTRNFTSGTFDKAEEISGAHMNKTILVRNESCWACAVRCKRVVEAKEPYEVDPEYGGPEYESIAALGSYLEIGDLVAVSKATELCNRYGIDTISMGGTLAFAMEAYENGLITKDELGGLDLKFGNADAALRMIAMVKDREGFGDVLAEGASAAAERIGRGAVKYAICSKRQEFPAHMPRVKASLALAYSTNPFGADHESSQHDPILASEDLSESIKSMGFSKTVPIEELNFEKVKLWAYTQKLYSALDTLELCQFCFGIGLLYGVDDMVRFVNAATGWNTNLWEIMMLGERRINLLRAFNMREGMSSNEDTLPDRIFEPLVGGCSEGYKIDRDVYATSRRQYYELMGWNPVTGNPTATKLAELGLEWITNL